jgi:thiol peroxidase
MCSKNRFLYDHADIPAKNPQQQETEMETRTGIITFMGNPLTLVGNELKKGDVAPEVTLIDNDLNPVALKNFQGKVVVVSAVPSLDTPICDMETRRFNQEAINLGDDVRVLTVSMDLPFAQKRWCGAAGVDRVQTLSDHREAAFGTSYGILIQELRLLARCIFVIDKKGIIAGVHMVNEVSNEPDYDAVLEIVKEAM